MADVNWWRVRNQSLAVAARNSGFDLAIYDQYSEAVKTELRKRTIKEAIRNIRDDFYYESGERDLKEITQGVYVICLSDPFVIEYESGISNVIYIGMGNIQSRLESHFFHSLFNFMRSLSGADFDFHLTEPVHKENEKYYKHIEFMLLDNFKTKIGNGKYPLLNKNAGAKQDITSVGKRWDAPLKRTGKRPSWSLKPTKHWDFKALD